MVKRPPLAKGSRYFVPPDRHEIIVCGKVICLRILLITVTLCAW
jgi:hypothetical protein